MKLTAKLAYSQLTANRKRTAWTLLGVILSSATISAVYSFLASGYAMYTKDTGENYYGAYMLTFVGIGAVIGLAVVAVSVNVISNAFSISAGERRMQFGILKSVGATKRQIAETVMYEGFMLSAAGIPAGTALGLVVTFINVNAANHFLYAWNSLDDTGSDLVFGFEGLLAAKSLKRSRRNFRAAVASLSVSVILFIMAGGIGALADNLTGILFPNIDVAVAVQAMSDFQISFGGDSEAVNFIYTPINSSTADEITARLRKFPDTNLIGAGGFYHAGSATLPETMITPEMRDVIGSRRAGGYYNVSTWLLTVDPKTYAKLCKQAGVPPGSNILVNFYRNNVSDESAITPYLFDNQVVSIKSAGIPDTDVKLHGQLKEVPEELLSGFTGTRSELTVIVPSLDAMYYNWFANPQDIEGFMEHANTVVNELIPQNGEVEMYVSVVDVSVATNAIRSIINLIKAFIYGFVGMLTLIGLTNVISTIAANVRSRSREFAVLRSIGMTHGGINRMLNLESILCSAKALIIGLPLGSGATLLIHRLMTLFTGFDYRFPWFAVVYCILGVFLITWVIMRYSAAQVRDGSIVDEIRKAL